MDLWFALNISIIKKNSIPQRIVQGTLVQLRLTVWALAHITDYVNGFEGSELIYELLFIYLFIIIIIIIIILYIL